MYTDELLAVLKEIYAQHTWTNTVGEEVFLEVDFSRHMLDKVRAVIAKAEAV
jgi:hypothetical protein